MIKVLRVDDRLLHGQVTAAWLNFYEVDTIVVANDKLITDQTMQIAFHLATPPGITLSMKSLEGAAAVINNPKHTARAMMVIVRDMQDAEYLCNKTTGAIKDILIGGLRSGAGKKQINMNSYMDEHDILAMNRLKQHGIAVAMQAVPDSRRLTVSDIQKNFNKSHVGKEEKR